MAEESEQEVKEEEMSVQEAEPVRGEEEEGPVKEKSDEESVVTTEEEKPSVKAKPINSFFGESPSLPSLPSPALCLCLFLLLHTFFSSV